MKANKKDSDEKIAKLAKEFKAMIAEIMDQINTLNPLQPRSIDQILWDLTMWYQITGGLQHWTVDSLHKLVACGL